MRVGISHEFFTKGLDDYSDWEFAWGRELFQNSVDSGAKNIDFTISYQTDSNTTLAICENNGRPMTESVLLDKFLCLGGTTKTDGTTVGGFGVAKVVIALAHPHYKIETGECQIEGSGGEYELSKQPKFHGTKTTITMAGDMVEELCRKIKRLAVLAQWSGTLTLNGDQLYTNHNKGSRRRDLGFGTVYTNRDRENILVVRIGGIPMFDQYCDIKRMVIVELAGRSRDVLTANRDGLRRPYNQQLACLVTELAVDKRKALRDRNKAPRYVKYAGERLRHSSKVLNVAAIVAGPELAPRLTHPSQTGTTEGGYEARDPEDPIRPAIEGIQLGEEGVAAIAPVTHEPTVRAPYAPSYGMGSDEEGVEEVFTPVRRIATLGSQFILKNETELQVPDYYKPDSPAFSGYSLKLIKIWGRLMLTLHRLFDNEAEFSIGFVFDEDAEAQHEDRDFGKVYYLAPAEIVEQKASTSRSFKKRFKLTERGRLISIAAHEFVHGLGYSDHNESFSTKYTDVMGVVLTNASKFAWCFK